MCRRKNKRIDLYIVNNFGTDCVKEYNEIVKNHIRYYHDKSCFCKFLYYFFSVVKTVSLSLIPVFQGIDLTQKAAWLIVTLSTLGLLIDSIINLFHLKEKWHLYRRTCNNVSAEQRKYAIKCEPYAGDDAFGLYVKNIERIIFEESQQWGNTVNRKEDQTESPK